MAGMTPTTGPARFTNTTLVRATAKHSGIPIFVSTAVALDAYVACDKCGRVVGVGMNRDDAISDAIENGTGSFVEGSGWRCNDHKGDK